MKAQGWRFFRWPLFNSIVLLLISPNCVIFLTQFFKNIFVIVSSIFFLSYFKCHFITLKCHFINKSTHTSKNPHQRSNKCHSSSPTVPVGGVKSLAPIEKEPSTRRILRKMPPYWAANWRKEKKKQLFLTAVLNGFNGPAQPNKKKKLLKSLDWVLIAKPDARYFYRSRLLQDIPNYFRTKWTPATAEPSKSIFSIFLQL